MELRIRHHLFISLAILIIVVAIFWPRNRPILRAGIGGHINTVGGELQLEAFETEDNPEEYKNYDGKMMVLFYAPWCPHCKSIMPEWQKFQDLNDTNVKVVKINCDNHPEYAKKFGVQGFPTIYFLPNGINNPKNFIEYKGQRKGEAFLSFILNQ